MRVWLCWMKRKPKTGRKASKVGEKREEELQKLRRNSQRSIAAGLEHKSTLNHTAPPRGRHPVWYCAYKHRGTLGRLLRKWREETAVYATYTGRAGTESPLHTQGIKDKRSARERESQSTTTQVHLRVQTNITSIYLYFVISTFLRRHIFPFLHKGIVAVTLYVCTYLNFQLPRPVKVCRKCQNFRIFATFPQKFFWHPTKNAVSWNFSLHLPCCDEKWQIIPIHARLSPISGPTTVRISRDRHLIASLGFVKRFVFRALYTRVTPKLLSTPPPSRTKTKDLSNN